MIKLTYISEALTAAIKRNITIDDTKAEQIEYGIYMAASEAIKLSILVIISLFLGIFPYVILATVIFGTHRGFIGGVHAKTHIGCFLMHSGIMLGTVYASLFVEIDKFILLLPSFLFCMTVIYIYAPADILNKPVVSKKQRKRLRTGGFTFMSLVFAAAFIVPQIYARVLIFVSVAECITMLPMVYKITGNEYGGKEVI